MRDLILDSTACIVLEGLDAAGKSTQVVRLRDRVVPDHAAFVHMPTGFTSFTARLRDLLEDRADRPSSGLAQQLAHLACHAEAMPALTDLAAEGAVVLDRWWWSTWVYGWESGAVDGLQISEEIFRELVTSIWKPFQASLVLVFLHPYQEDQNNSSAIASGYRRLLDSDPAAVAVPTGSADEVSDWIAGLLVSRGLASRGVSTG